jgi:uncharacterized protein (DUF2147 family)
MQLRLTLLAALLATIPFATRAAPGIFGRWLTQDRDGVIELAPCGPDLCGRIVGLDLPRLPNGDVPRDPQGRPQCGLQILHARPDGAGGWAGRITDPSDGTDWTCTLRLDAEGRVKLRGYVLVPLLGATQTWTPFTGTIGADCKFK